MREKRNPVPWYWWPFWMLLLALGLIVFYVFFTPGLDGYPVRLVARRAAEPRSGEQGLGALGRLG